MNRPRRAVTVETTARGGDRAGGRVRVPGFDEPVDVERVADGDSGTYRVTLGDRRFEVVIAREPGVDWGWVDGRAFRWPRDEAAARNGAVARDGDAGNAADREDEPAGGAEPIRAPMPGIVTAVLTEAGQVVARGDTLVVIEAMKMELPVKAPRAGRVSAVRCAVGDRVDPETPLVALDTSETEELP